MKIGEFNTSHVVHFEDAADMAAIVDGGADLIVTSPPYPMIAMWDELLGNRDPGTGNRLANGDGVGAFEAMHRQLDRVWEACWRVLRDGGFACVNIGDAVRTIGGSFQLYPNHARVLSAAQRIGFSPLPAILWRKPTNAPTKFMGSGMLPAGAYVTLEHEYILILRKGGKRVFGSEEEKRVRRGSALFWEERNAWFSDVWTDLRGTTQALGGAGRDRSGAFPFELPRRLIYMYSVQGDVVLDPFMGTGTTGQAAAVAGRSSVGYELDRRLTDAIEDRMAGVVEIGREEVTGRLAAHRSFVSTWEAERGPMKHRNDHYGFAVMTGQEREMVLTLPVSVEKQDGGYRVRQEEYYEIRELGNLCIGLIVSRKHEFVSSACFTKIRMGPGQETYRGDNGEVYVNNGC